MYLYVRSILTLVVTLYTSRVILDQLGVTDYGIYNVVTSVATFMTIISGTLSQAMCRFMSFEITISDNEKLKQLYSTCINIVTIASVICLILLETIGLWFVNYKLVIPEDRLFAANVAYQGAILIFLTVFFTTPFNAEIIAHENMKVFARIAIVDVFLRLGIALSLQWIEGDKLMVYAVLLVLQSLLLVTLYYIYCKRHYEECSYVRVIDKGYISKLFSFSGWTFMGSLAFVCKESGINFILNIFCGPVVNAARAVASQVINSTSILGNQFLQATVPQITKLYAENKLEEMHLLISRSCRYAFLLFFFIAFPVFCFTPQILGIWLVVVPNLSSEFIRILLFQVLIKVMSSPLVTGINSTGSIKKYYVFFSLFEFLTLPLSYILLRVGFSPLSTAVVIVIAELSEMLCKLYFSCRTYQLSVRKYFKQICPRAIPIIVLAIIVYFAAQQFEVAGLTKILFGFAAVAVLNACVIFILGIDKREKELIKGAVLSRLKK